MLASVHGVLETLNCRTALFTLNNDNNINNNSNNNKKKMYTNKISEEPNARLFYVN